MGFARSAGVYEGSSWGGVGFVTGWRAVRGCVLKGSLLASVLLGFAASLAGEPAAPVPGLEAWGNVDGVLTWHLGRLAPGETNRTTVLIGFADSRDDLIRAVAVAREKSGGEWRVDTAAAGSQVAESPTAMSWLIGASADFALDARGAFNWEGHRQCLTNATGGQLSQFGYALRFRAGANGGDQRAVAAPNQSENVRVVQSVHLVSATDALGTLGTEDGRCRWTIHARVEGAFARVRYEVVNPGGEDLEDVRLSVYANPEAAHTHGNDYGTLDPELGGLLALDPPTGGCVGMAGITPPAAGYAGTYESRQALREGEGIARDRWKPFAGLSPEWKAAMARAAMPHPPAPRLNLTEPETRSLSSAEGAAALERDWLAQAGSEEPGARAGREIQWARALVRRLARRWPALDFASELAGLDALDARLKATRTGEKDARRDLYLDVRRLKRGLAFKNPAVDFESVLFIDQPYPQGSEWPHQARHRNGMMAMPGGRLLALDGLHPGGRLRKVADLPLGSYWRPDLSFDAHRVLFCYKAAAEPAFHLYEVGIDGSGLRQLTEGPYDDLDPIYLPDGHLMFTSTRANTYVRCMPYTYSYVLARCDADGKNVYLISQNSEPDWLPSLLEDGRVIYSRWEYTDKALWRIQSLWTVNPDGTGVSAFWGNQSVWPDHLAEPRAIPGSSRVMFTGLAHHNWFDGSIGIVDARLGANFPVGLTKVTREIPWPECGAPPVDPGEAEDYHASAGVDAYKTPYPLNEEDFLVSARSQGRFQLYLMDVHGNRELICGGAHHIWHALPVKARQRPPVLVERVAWPGTGEARKPAEPGVFYSANVYEGTPDLPAGKVRYLRVFQMDPRTYSSWTRDGRFSGPAVSLVQDDGVKRVLGEVPVAADGSVSFMAPPGVALHFQALDDRYRALQTMRSFTGVMPGEKRGCVGCHESHSVAPVAEPALALRRRPAELAPPWGGESVSYERFVQPALDRHCGACHQGEGKARAAFDLTLRPGHLFFKEPYVSLVGYAQFSGLPETGKPALAGALMVENFPQSDPQSYATVRPLAALSYRSRLVELATSGKHYGARLDEASRRRLITWVDANCPYRGDEDVRSLADPEFPGIEELAVRPRVRTAPAIARP